MHEWKYRHGPLRVKILDFGSNRPVIDKYNTIFQNRTTKHRIHCVPTQCTAETHLFSFAALIWCSHVVKSGIDVMPKLDYFDLLWTCGQQVPEAVQHVRMLRICIQPAALLVAQRSDQTCIGVAVTDQQAGMDNAFSSPASPVQQICN